MAFLEGQSLERTGFQAIPQPATFGPKWEGGFLLHWHEIGEKSRLQPQICGVYQARQTSMLDWEDRRGS